jgi:hypothetical protein
MRQPRAQPAHGTLPLMNTIIDTTENGRVDAWEKDVYTSPGSALLLHERCKDNTLCFPFQA